MSYTFTHIDDYTGDIVEVYTKNDDVTWVDVLARFQDFLNGCGFIVDKVEVDIAELANEAHKEAMQKKATYRLFQREHVTPKQVATKACCEAD